MAKQQESNIEDFAPEYLYSYYCTRHNNKSIFNGTAEATKYGPVADNLLALKTPEHDIFVAVLNTGLSHKLAGMLTSYKKKGPSKLRYLTAVVLLAGAAYGGKVLVGHWAALYVLPIIAALTGLVLHAVLEQKYLKRKVARLVDELKQLPANEQWIGISVSSLAFRNNKLANHLLALCKRRGIGIITVGKRAKVVNILEATTVKCRKGDFLSFYASEDIIRKALDDNSVLRVA